MRDALDRPLPPALDLDRSRALRVSPLAVIVAVAAALCIVAFDLPALASSWADLSTVLLLRQDRWLLLVDLALLAVACLRLRAGIQAIALPALALWATAAALVCLCVAGHVFVLQGYDMSRDEQMAVFDAHILATGRLAAPLPPAWRAHADALNLLFMLPVAHPVAWVSAYLPMNAALRVLFGSLTGPLMTGLGLLFLWRCARRLWPQDREAASVAALLYVASGQVLFAGMTAYAMPAHLALDLLWLWLFLIGRPAADCGALAVAAVATGLHQPLFHPLFALPFLIGLARERAWARAALYATGYAVICAIWLAWPMIIHLLVAGAGSAIQPAGTDYLSRLAATVTTGDPARWPDMTANLLRFAAWQPVLLMPLMAAGVVLARRERPTMALAAGVALPIVVMGVILPYQGHGFGYRYLHGVLGPAILLAVQGHRHLVPREPRLRPLLVRTTIAGLLLILPLQAWLAHAFYAPAASIDARIDASGADYAIIGADDAPFARDLVLNRPDVSNRPIRLLGNKVDDALIADICRPGVHVLMPTNRLFAAIDAYFSSEPSGAADARFARMSAKLGAAGCMVKRLGP